MKGNKNVKTQTKSQCFFDPVTDVCVMFRHMDAVAGHKIVRTAHKAHLVSGRYEFPADYWPLGKTAEEMLEYALNS